MSPFKVGKENVFHIQSNILIALVPVIIWGTFVFGFKVITATSLSVIASTLVEIIFFSMAKNLKNFFRTLF